MAIMYLSTGMIKREADALLLGHGLVACGPAGAPDLGLGKPHPQFTAARVGYAQRTRPDEHVAVRKPSTGVDNAIPHAPATVVEIHITHRAEAAVRRSNRDS